MTGRHAAARPRSTPAALLSLGALLLLPWMLAAQNRYTIDPVALSLNVPVRMAFPPDNSGRLFYLELTTGNVMVLNGSGAQNGLWLHLDVANEGERGLLGIVFDPNFATNHHLYLYFTAPGNPPHNRVERFTEVNNRGDLASRLLLYDETVATVCGTFTNHNAGALVFGTDGKLYISIGENNCPLLAADSSDPRGKILRIEPDIAAPNNAVTSNPWYDDGNPGSGSDDRVFAKGFRNSFGMTLSAIDSFLYATENGPDCNDEINRIVAGRDYAWRPACNLTTINHCACSQNSPYAPPLWVVTPTISPTGLIVYSGPLYPELVGKVVFVDNNTRSIRAGTFNAGRDALAVEVISQPNVGPLFDIASGPDGLIYFSSPDGIRRLRPLGTGAEEPLRPSDISLSPNYPNPFNPVTEVRFSLARAATVSLKIFDLFGREVATLVEGMRGPGEHRAQWDAAGAASGVYLCRLPAGGHIETRSMMLIR